MKFSNHSDINLEHQNDNSATPRTRSSKYIIVNELIKRTKMLSKITRSQNYDTILMWQICFRKWLVALVHHRKTSKRVKFF